MNQKKQVVLSTVISEFLNSFSNAQKDYSWNCDEINRLDKLTQDYLHQLELNNLNYKERAKIATKLSLVRQERRNSKDTVEILEPLIEYLDSDKGQQMLNLVKEVLGKTRKTEKRMTNRVYRYRVIDDDDIVNHI